ncbi:MAG: hypothetical protein FWH20_08930 [Oscillospiraceae bacterium]|nr:hypothetical protein [Oscillospiraceae bacterium]
MKKLPVLLLAAILALQVFGFTACQEAYDPAFDADFDEEVEEVEEVEDEHEREVWTPTFEDSPFWQDENSPIIGTWGRTSEYELSDGEIAIFTHEVSYNADGRFYALFNAHSTDDIMEILYTYVDEGVYITVEDVLMTITERKIEVQTGEIVSDDVKMETVAFSIIGDTLTFGNDDVTFKRTEPSGIWSFDEQAAIEDFEEVEEVEDIEDPAPEIDTPASENSENFEDSPFWQADSPIIGTWAVEHEHDDYEEYGFDANGRCYWAYRMENFKTVDYDGNLIFVEFYLLVLEGIYITNGDVLEIFYQREIEQEDDEIIDKPLNNVSRMWNFSIVGDTLEIPYSHVENGIEIDDYWTFERAESAELWSLD